ncbi:MAG: 16S rRNA (adenine(1518)-N(6)/adenine(1519)-N(6))-dimethyltransferase RsmA [Eubacteriales bacterium]|nr:16S rRNA (adenine(1518)-N(6)/adenine(1519)-N(6))-dimethyltransferase RsmA [Eubacteriales bacterium]
MKINVTSPKVVKELMDRYSIAPLKRYGQNFLIDGNIAGKIAAAAVPEGACALEIGPGLGALTARLADRAKAVAAYEIDAGLVRALKDTFSDAHNLTIFHQDFLKADLEKDLKTLFNDGDIYVAANLPYYITSPCIMNLVTARLNIKRITVMIQKEVAERICAAPGSRDYGAISAAVSFFAIPRMLFAVTPACFYPKPDVHSAVMTLEMKTHHTENEKDYLKTVKGLFAKRRKTVKSNLRQSFGLSMDEADAVLKKVGIDENARAEMLSVSDFIKISQELFDNSKIL